ncbi:hypothetical protein CTI12_AA042860 [Artemisia annua]|uniref:Midasin AAA lid domain-containing protein n=1 Tax=Artemisia annua TaxID=35608 RepID=A0A2U1QDR8_ARTAN|nr:hypothetical protein CTI12_AA042860 [Artemisia annua]
MEPGGGCSQGLRNILFGGFSNQGMQLKDQLKFGSYCYPIDPSDSHERVRSSEDKHSRSFYCFQAITVNATLKCGSKRAIYDGFAIFFLSMLDPPSAKVMDKLIERHLLDEKAAPHYTFDRCFDAKDREPDVLTLYDLLRQKILVWECLFCFGLDDKQVADFRNSIIMIISDKSPSDEDVVVNTFKMLASAAYYQPAFLVAIVDLKDSTTFSLGSLGPKGENLLDALLLGYLYTGFCSVQAIEKLEKWSHREFVCIVGKKPICCRNNSLLQLHDLPAFSELHFLN